MSDFSKDQLDELAANLMRGVDVNQDIEPSYATEEVIADQRETHVLDNGAFQEIADGAPIEPADYDAAHGLTPEDEGEAPDESHDEVVGSDERTNEAVALGVDSDNLRGSDSTDGLFRDDFVELARRRAAAAYGPNGEILDDFHQRFMEQQAEHGELQQAAPFSRDNPVSVLNGLLGGNASVMPGQFVEVVNWQGEDAETTSCTVTLGQALYSPAAQVQPQLRPFARVQWGTRGFLVEADVDIGTGTQFTIGASSVRVQVSQDQPDSGSVAAPVALTAMLSFRQVTRGAIPTRTAYLSNATNIPNAASFVTVPLYAKTVAFWRGGPGGQYAFKLHFIDSSGVDVYQYTVAANAFMTPIEFSGDIVQIAVENTTPGVNNGRLVFGLSL